MDPVASAKGPTLAQVRRTLPQKVPLALAIAVFAVLVNAWVFFDTLKTRSESADAVTQTQQILERIQNYLSALRDAETSQRGYLLTGNRDYLAPYELAVTDMPNQIAKLRELAARKAIDSDVVESLNSLTTDKMAELAETIHLTSNQQPEAALAVVRANRGKVLMDAIRSKTNRISNDARADLAVRQKQWIAAVQRSAVTVQIDTAVLLLLVLAAGMVAWRDHRRHVQQAWVRSGQMQFNQRVRGDQRLEELGDNVLSFLGEYLNIGVGSLYVNVTLDHYTRIAGYAHPGGNEIQARQNLLGQAVRENRPLHIKDVPEDYLPISSALGKNRARELLIAPATAEGVAYGALELGFLRALLPSELELLQLISVSLGIALRTASDRSRLEELLEETQRQSEELQAQQEELRVNNEELEEQGRTLKLSQVQLEAQQIELEQTNTQLEEQMQMLEAQRDELSSSQAQLVQKAADLERSNQFKSEFVANMSHELRTPLNSTLILSKLLADNREGGLSEQQMSYANTIHAAGNDLLSLINDILDISKIEAGKLEIDPQPIHIAAMVGGLSSSFAVNAEVKKLRFLTHIDADVPDSFVSDELRLGQVLKNLLSNAIKFTSHGEVELRVKRLDADTLQFAVRDTGIGIPASQQDIIFEAFRQADGSTHRRYGGSGLGLSIARDLAALLGGSVSVSSIAGEGSVFTLTLPLQYAAPVQSTPTEPGSLIGAALEAQATESAALAPSQTNTAPAVLTADDRERLLPSARTILVIEDDSHFAAILRDVTKELGFQCVIVQTAREGYAMAVSLQPSAILLDIKLPDYSGLAVLDQLKHEPSTRHIPVHVISGLDYSREALERGAVGYALKPVKHEQLVDALHRLEAKFSQVLKRVLVVEDDDRQRDSVQQLLASDNVHITGASSATLALELLKTENFDCMVMDLNLPDMTGFELLVRMAEQDGASFPPVIIYTGRSLSAEEERQLKRFSRSIIIKSARSPERLLDEVTLFIHQVELRLPAERQRMLRDVRNRDEALEGRRVLIVEDDERNIFALTSMPQTRGVIIEVARNGRQALDTLFAASSGDGEQKFPELVLMDIMMPEMDGLTAMREIRKNSAWRKLPIIALTAKAMRDDQEACLAAGANDYMAKPLDVERLLSLIRVWMPH